VVLSFYSNHYAIVFHERTYGKQFLWIFEIMKSNSEYLAIILEKSV
jgi:hypothetical protein